MKAAAKELEFEKAALLRDQVMDLRRVLASGTGSGGGLVEKDLAGVSTDLAAPLLEGAEGAAGMLSPATAGRPRRVPSSRARSRR
jgi:hypothetical protein